MLAIPHECYVIIGCASFDNLEAMAAVMAEAANVHGICVHIDSGWGFHDLTATRLIGPRTLPHKADDEIPNTVFVWLPPDDHSQDESYSCERSRCKRTVRKARA
jgi:hypothetical protein